MKKTRALLLFASFFPCCGPQPQFHANYFNYHRDQPISEVRLLALEQIKAPDLAMPTPEKALELGIEQWRLLPGHEEYWRQFTPLQAYYYDWLDIRKVKRRRFYPW